MNTHAVDESSVVFEVKLNDRTRTGFPAKIVRATPCPAPQLGEISPFCFRLQFSDLRAPRREAQPLEPYLEPHQERVDRKFEERVEVAPQKVFSVQGTAEDCITESRRARRKR